MNAIDFLNQSRIYEDDVIYNSVGEMVGTLSQLMEEYAALRQSTIESSVCDNCGEGNPMICEK